MSANKKFRCGTCRTRYKDRAKAQKCCADKGMPSFEPRLMIEYSGHPPKRF